MVWTIIIFLIVLSVLVLAHEFGHFRAARWLKVGAEEFGLGFPPRALGFQITKRRHLEKNAEGKKARRWRFIRGNRDLNADDIKFGTVYSLNWIPLGGFVKIKGIEDFPGEKSHGEVADKDNFSGRSIWQRLFILAAGVLMNIVLAFVLFTIVFAVGMPQETTGPGNIQIQEVSDKSPAQAAGILMGDVIVSIDQKTFSDISDLQTYINSHKDQAMKVGVRRGQQVIDETITPKVTADSAGRAVMGVALAKTAQVKYPWYQAIWEAAKYTISILGTIIVAFYNLIKNLITGQSVGDAVGGPVRIAQITGQVANVGFVYLLNFVALLSLNLAVVNFLPFPPLDGGRILFLVIESIRRKPVKKEIENIVNNIGFLLLMALLAWVTFKDVIKIFIK